MLYCFLQIKTKVQAVEVKYADHLEHAEQKFDELQALEKNTGTGLIYSAKGKPIADKVYTNIHTYIINARGNEYIWIFVIQSLNSS